MSAALRASLVHRDGQKKSFSAPAGSNVRDLAQAVETLREGVCTALTELVDQEKVAGGAGGGDAGRGDSAGEEEADECDDDDGGGGDKSAALTQAEPLWSASGSKSRQAACDGGVKRGARQREASAKSPAKKKKN